MNDFVILADSSCDLVEDMRKKYDIADYLPGYIVHPDGHSELSDLDWKQVDPYDFYSSMSNNCMYKTAQRSPAAIKEFYKKYLLQEKNILSIVLSSGLSGTCNSCKLIAKELMEEYPDKKIICIDSRAYSGGLGLLCTIAGTMKKDGKSLEEIADHLNSIIPNLHQMGTVDDLIFLRKMGRVSNMTAIMGTLVGVKPLADLNTAGVNEVIGKTTGYKNAYKAIIEYMKKTIVNPHEQTIFLSYTNRKAQAMKLKEYIEAEIGPREIITTVVCKSCGAAIGPGMVVAFYFGSPTSEGLKEEKKILEGVLK